MTYETLEVRRNGPVGWLIFDRPDQSMAAFAPAPTSSGLKKAAPRVVTTFIGSALLPT